MVPAGRRSGKTEKAKRKIVRRALAGTDFLPARFFAAAPTRQQAKDIYWSDLKAMCPPEFVRDISETELKITLPLAEIVVVGMDKPERFEGQPWDGGVLDEYANMKAKVWPEHVRPALSDRLAWCDLIGVPEGRNHYYEKYQDALAEQMEHGDESEWGVFTWPSRDILPESEVEAARKDLDELTFRQEYEASFINFTGRAYYAFTDENKARLEYHEDGDLAFCFDFNVSPGIAAVAQEQELPNDEIGTGFIGEVHIPRNSNTEAVCRRLIEDWGAHLGRVFVYGDATGGARGSAKVTGSDWDIVRRELVGHFGSNRVHFRVPKSNPAERARINAVNTRCRAGDGTIRLMVDPTRCPQLVRDFEGVRLLEGGSGEIDKKADPHLSHLTDAIGYYIQREFPTTTRSSGSSNFAVV